MKYAAEMGLGAMIYTPSFINIGSSIQKLIARDSDTHKSTLLFSKIWNVS
jgi:hypothetical protein